MEVKDASFGFDFDVVYDEINEGEKMRYTMGDGRKAIVTFNSEREPTTIIIPFDAENENAKDLQREEWQAILNHFKAYTEAH